MIKKITLYCMLIVMLLCGALFASCSCGGSDEDEVTQEKLEQVSKTYDITAPVDSMIMGDYYSIPIDFVYTDGLVVEYTSSNPEIASVDKDGKIEAITVGKTTISRIVNGYADSFDLDVVTGNYIPSIEFENGLKDYNYLERNQQISVKPVVRFNGRIYTDCVATYSLSSQTAGTVNDTTGLFSAGNSDSAVQLTVSISWRCFNDYSIKKTINLEVLSEFTVLIDGGVLTSIELYSKRLTDEPTSIDLTDRISASYNGQDCEYTWELVNNTDNAVSRSGSVITALSAGRADLRVNVNTTDGVKPFDFSITVSRPIVTVQQPIAYFETAIGEIPNLSTIIEGETPVQAYQDGRTLTLTNENKILGIGRKIPDAMSVENLTLNTEVCAYEFQLETYTRVLDDASDLSALYLTREQLTQLGVTEFNQDTVDEHPIKGYYFVKNDIEYDPNYMVKTDVASGVYSSFGGVFDGNGKTIEFGVDSNYGSQRGLFGRLYYYSEVKNASFVAKGFADQSKGCYILADRIWGWHGRIKIQNIYARYDIADFTPPNTSVGLASLLLDVDLVNVVVDMMGVNGINEKLNAQATEYTSSYGVFGDQFHNKTYGSGRTTFVDTFVISNVPYLGYVTYKGEVYDMRFAEGDEEIMDAFNKTGEYNKYVLPGTLRFNGYVEAKEYFAKPENASKLTAFSSIANIELGFPLEGTWDTFVQGATEMSIDASQVNSITFDAQNLETQQKTVTFDYLGQAQTVTLSEESDVNNVVTIENNKVTYSAGSVGNATIKATATVEGVTCEKTITVSVSVTALTGEIYHDGEGEEPFLLPASITEHISYNASTLKVVDKSDSSVIIQDGANVLTTQKAMNKVIKTSYVFCGDTILGEIDVVCVAKLVTKASDITGLYRTWAISHSDSYYLVMNDILYANDPLVANPCYPADTSYGAQHSSSQSFSGVFDGNGHTIEYSLTGGGLFGAVTGAAQILNATLVVKDVDLTSTKADKYSAIAGHAFYSTNASYPKVENVFVKYELPQAKCTPDIVGTGIGLFGSANGVAFTNVVVDMSCITGVKDKIEADTAKAGNVSVFGARTYSYSLVSWVDLLPVTMNNCYVIWDNPYVRYANYEYYEGHGLKNIVAVVTGEGATTLTPTETLAGVTRINALTDVSGDIAVGDYYKITSAGVVRNA